MAHAAWCAPPWANTLPFLVSCSTFFQSGMLVDDARHPVSLYDPKKKGDFVTVAALSQPHTANLIARRAFN